jgi:hypothetical protein
MMRRLLPFACVAVLAVLVLTAVGSAAADDWTPLFNGKDLSGWKTFVDPKSNVEPSKIWSVKDDMIICMGDPFGYIITEKEFGDYELKLQWRWGEKVTKSRNSGVLLHCSGPDKIWPKCFEAQLFAGRAGDIWLVDGFKLTVDEKRKDPKQARHFLHLKDDVEKKIGEWNEYHIVCKGNSVKLTVNGVLSNEGTDAELSKGKIALQSEGGEIHFQKIMIKPAK